MALITALAAEVAALDALVEADDALVAASAAEPEMLVTYAWLTASVELDGVVGTLVIRLVAILRVPAAVIIAADKVFVPLSVCAAPVPTTSPVTPCTDVVATSCWRDSVKSRADTPCSTLAPKACALAPDESMLRVI